MSFQATVNPYSLYLDTSGKPLDSGFLYFGQPFQDPEQFPVPVFWDENGTIPAQQPIRTVSGYPVRNGSPAVVYAAAQYSLRVLDKDRRQVFYNQNVVAANLSGGGYEPRTAAAGQTVFNLATFTYEPGANALDVHMNGLLLTSGVDYLETDQSTVTLVNAAGLNDQLIFQARNVFSATQANLVDFQSRTFNGAGGASQNFTLTSNPGSVSNVWASVAGSVLRPGVDFTLSGNVVTVTPGPVVGTNNVLIRWGRSLPQDALRADLADTTNPANGAALVGYEQQTIQTRLAERPSIADTGALPDGSDVVALLNAQIAAVGALGGGEVFLPRGEWTVGPVGGSSAVILADNVTLCGAGQGSTIIKLQDSANSQVIVATNVTNVGLRDLTIDGNRANQTAQVHGVRLAGVDGFTCQNVEIKNCAYYGIGGQDGTFKRIKISKTWIHDVGGDGIDFKNRNDDNEDIQLDSLTIQSWGLDGTASIQAAIDIRGPARIDKVWVSDPGQNDSMGVRFRQGETTDANGFGGHRSSMTNFDIRMGSATTAIGLSVVARDVTVGQGYISGGFRGVVVQDSGFRGTAITVEGASNHGFLLDALGGGLDADNCELTACYATGCGDRGFSIEGDGNQLLGCYALNNDDGFFIEASADSTTIIGGRVNGNATSAITSGGTNSVIRNVDGYRTENRGTATLLNGTTSIVVNHGLANTPALGDILVTPQTSDGAATQFWIGTATATTFTIFMDVDPGKDVPFSWRAQIN